jgi:hypothetical protein
MYKKGMSGNSSSDKVDSNSLLTKQKINSSPFLLIWLLSVLSLSVLNMLFAKHRGAEFYLLTFIFTPFWGALPLAVTVGTYCFGLSKVARGHIKQGNAVKLLALILTLLVFIFIIRMR